MENNLNNILRLHALEVAQIQSALRLRLNLQLILAEIREVYSGVKFLCDDENRLYKSLKDWEMQDPKGYIKYEKWKSLSMETYYMLESKEFRLFPSWIDKTHLANLFKLWQQLIPPGAMTLHLCFQQEGNQRKFEELAFNVIGAIDALFPDK